jgi:hypothetical protein
LGQESLVVEIEPATREARERPPYRGDITDTACVVLSTTVMNAQASA